MVLIIAFTNYKLKKRKKRKTMKIDTGDKGVNMNAKGQQYEMSYQKKQNNNTISEFRVVKNRFRQSRNIQNGTVPSEFLRNF